MSVLDRTALIGRGVAVDDLRALLDQADTGLGQGAVITGEAGIGKTRLLEELAAQAARRSTTVAWGRCTDLEGAAPFGPWRDVLDALGVPRAEAAGSRAQVLDALLRALSAATRESTVLVCVEDLHWADGDVRWLLRGVLDATAGRRLLVVGSARSPETTAPEAGTPALAGLPPRVHRLSLRRLEDDAARALAAAVAGGALPDDALDDAATRSGGNPLFVRELVRARVAGGGGRVPDGIRDVIARRLAHLPTGTVAVVRAVAVHGARAALPVVARTAGCDDAEALRRLAPAEAAGLVEVTGGSATLVHAIVRDVLLAEAGPGARAQLHERAARALTGPEALDETLALHWSHVPGEDAARALVHHGRSARERARRAHALEQAVAFAELVHRRSGDVADLIALGDARSRRGDRTAGRADLLAAADQAVQAGRPDLLAHAALALAAGEGGFEVRLDDTEQVRLLRAAADALPTGGLRAAVRARLAVATSVDRPLPERLALAAEAVREAEAAADDGALLQALSGYADMVAGPAHRDRRRALAERMLAVSQRLGDAEGELLAHRFRLVALLEDGRFAEAELEAAAFERVATTTREPAHTWYPSLWRGMRALLAGRVADADAHCDEVERLGAAAQSGNAAVLAGSLRLAIHLDDPDWLRSVLPLFESVASDPVLAALPQVRVVHACLLALAGERARAEREYRPVAEGRFASVPVDAEYLGSLVACVEVALVLEDTRGAEDLAELLRPWADRWIVDGIGAALVGVVAEHLWRLESFLGDPGAEGHRGQARAAYERARAPLLLRRLDAAADAVAPLEHRGTLRRSGDAWIVGWNARQVVLPDLKGVRDLALLLVRPGVPVTALTLLAEGAGVSVDVPGGADEVLDERARTAYRDRLRELEDSIADATRTGDAAQAERCRREREFLARELSAALGLGGRSRRLGDDGDRARKAVTMRLRDLLGRLDRVLPELAAHLRPTLRTGRECVYAPLEPVRWDVSR